MISGGGVESPLPLPLVAQKINSVYLHVFVSLLSESSGTEYDMMMANNHSSGRNPGHNIIKGELTCLLNAFSVLNTLWFQKNIHTYPPEGHWKFERGGEPQRPKLLKGSMKLNWNFKRNWWGGVQARIPSMGEYGYFLQ